MLDHISLGTCDLARATRFHDAVLAPLGIVRVWTRPEAVGYGRPGEDDRLAIKLRVVYSPPGAGFHLAFTAASRTEVDACHRAALEQGAIDDGAPGLRPQYGPGYYAAFVIDPDGHRLEVVCHEVIA